jgi:hypothetical protein
MVERYELRIVNFELELQTTIIDPVNPRSSASKLLNFELELDFSFDSRLETRDYFVVSSRLNFLDKIQKLYILSIHILYIGG